jgi:uncharacterized Zn-finger protein
MRPLPLYLAAPETIAKSPGRVTKGPPLSTPDPSAPEIVTVHSHRVACDGVGGALGHPRVWMEIGAAGFVECGYCDRRFVLASDHNVVEDEKRTPGVYEGAGGH